MQRYYAIHLQLIIFTIIISMRRKLLARGGRPAPWRFTFLARRADMTIQARRPFQLRLRKYNLLRSTKLALCASVIATG